MRKLLALVLLLCSVAQAQDSLLVKIANWKDDKKAAIVFTFDDWSPGHGTIVYPLFKKYDLKATFFVTLKNKDLGGGFETMKSAYADGFEIGNHTHTHADLSQLSPTELHKEVTEAQEVLRQAIHPKCANTFAYPFGIYNPKVLSKTKETHIAARGANLSYGRMWSYSLMFGKTDYFQLQTFMARDIYTPQTYSRLATSAADQGGMIVFMYHSIFNDSINDKWFGPISESLLEAHVKAIKKHQDSIWITTFENAVMYHKEKANTQLDVQKNDKVLNVRLTNSLNKNQYFQPLTVVLEGIDVLKIKGIIDKNTGREIYCTKFDSEHKIQFNILPFDSEILVEF